MNHWHRELWLFRGNVTLNVSWGASWDLSDMPKVEARTNGWRIGDRCLDATLRIGRLNLNAVFWNMPFAKVSHYWDDDR